MGGPLVAIAFVGTIGMSSSGCFDSVPCNRPACQAEGLDGGGSRWDDEEAFVLPAASFVEAELWLATGTLVTIEFESRPSELYWDIHSHDGNQLVVHTSGESSADVLEFLAPASCSYWPMFSNPSDRVQDLSVRLSIDGEGSVAGWR
jgi:hypothetical protein